MSQSSQGLPSMDSRRWNHDEYYSDGGTGSQNANKSQQHLASRDSYHSPDHLQQQHHPRESYQSHDHLKHQPRESNKPRAPGSYQSADSLQKQHQPLEHSPDHLQKQQPLERYQSPDHVQKQQPQEHYRSPDHLRKQHQVRESYRSSDHLQQQFQPPRQSYKSQHQARELYQHRPQDPVMIASNHLPSDIDHPNDVHPSSHSPTPWLKAQQHDAQENYESFNNLEQQHQPRESHSNHHHHRQHQAQESYKSFNHLGQQQAPVTVAPVQSPLVIDYQKVYHPSGHQSSLSQTPWVQAPSTHNPTNGGNTADDSIHVSDKNIGLPRSHKKSPNEGCCECCIS